jgi:hypothetical protein
MATARSPSAGGRPRKLSQQFQELEVLRWGGNVLCIVGSDVPHSAFDGRKKDAYDTCDRTWEDALRTAAS